MSVFSLVRQNFNGQFDKAAALTFKKLMQTFTMEFQFSFICVGGEISQVEE